MPFIPDSTVTPDAGFVPDKVQPRKFVAQQRSREAFGVSELEGEVPREGFVEGVKKRLDPIGQRSLLDPARQARVEAREVELGVKTAQVEGLNLISHNVFGRPVGFARALASGKNPIEGFKKPEEQPGFGDLIISQIPKRVRPPEHIVPLESSRGILNFVFDAAVLHGIFGIALPAAKAKVGKIYSGAQGKAAKELRTTLIDTFKRAGVDELQALDQADLIIAESLGKGSAISRSPINIRRTNAIVKANKGKIARTINAIKTDADRQGFTKEFFRKAQESKPTISAKPQPTTLGVRSKIEQSIPTLAKRSFGKDEINAMPPDIKQKIIAEKLSKAKSNKHRNAIKKRYDVQTERIMVNPATATPTTDPLLKPETIFNPKDKASRIINARIDAVLERKKTKAQLKLRTKGTSVTKINPVIDTTLAFQGVEERSGLPLFSKTYNEIVPKANQAIADTSVDMNKYHGAQTKGFHTPESEARIIEAIVKKRGTLNEKEQRTADALIGIFKDIQPRVKYLVMRRMIDGSRNIIPGTEALVEEGRAILNSKGREALEAFVKDKNFGVITDDRYVPANMLRGINLGSPRENAFSVFDPHTLPRTAQEQQFTDMPIIKRLGLYLKRINSDYHLYDSLRDLKTAVDSVRLDRLDREGIENWVSALQGRPVSSGVIEERLKKARGQFFKAQFSADPTKIARNLLHQNLALLRPNFPLVENIKRTLGAKRIELNQKQLDFFRTHISNLKPLREEQLFIYDSFLEKGFLSSIDRLAVRGAEFYSATDELNRMSAFKFILSGSKKLLTRYKTGDISLNKLMKNQGLASFTDLELKYVLGLPIEEAQFQMARLLIEKTHVRYKKHERGTAALSGVGEVATTLVQFPKTYITRFIDAGRAVIAGRSHQQRWSGAQMIIGSIMMEEVVRNMYRTFVGEKEYFDPDLKRVVKSDPFSLESAMKGILGSAFQSNHYQTVATISKLSADLAFNSINGNLNEKQQLTQIRQILKLSDTLGESYFPFARKSFDVLEGAIGVKSFKLLTSSFDRITDRVSALEKNKIERTLTEGVSHAIFGTERGGEE